MRKKRTFVWCFTLLLFITITRVVTANDMCEVIVSVPAKPWKIRMSIPRDYGLSDPTDPRSPTHGQKNLLMRAQWTTGDVLTLLGMELPSGLTCKSIAERHLSELAKVKGLDTNTLEDSIHPGYLLYTYIDSYGLRKYWLAFFTYRDNCINLMLSKPQSRWDDSQDAAAIIDSVMFID